MIKNEDKLHEMVEFCYQIAEEHYGREFKRVPVSFVDQAAYGGQVTDRITFTPYGVAHRPTSMTFNATLFAENPETYYNEVIPHEVAHVIDLYVNGSTGHRKNWKNIMQYVYGLEPKTYHSMDTTNSQKRRVARPHVYLCGCQEHKLTNNIHGKMQKGQRRYCNSCKEFLVYDRSEK